MWARVAELMLGCWLCASPFVFGHAERPVWLLDVSAGGAVIVLALACWWHPLRRAHLAIAAIGLALVAWGWWRSREEGMPAFQNHILTGLILAMLGIVPSHASDPPDAWRERYARRPGG